MNIQELAQILKKKNTPVKIRCAEFEPDTYVMYSNDYPAFYCQSQDNPAAGDVMEWWPSLDTLMSDTWEIIPEMTFSAYLAKKQDNLAIMASDWSSMPEDKKPLIANCSEAEWDEWWSTRAFLKETGEI